MKKNACLLMVSFGMSAGPREWTDTFANDTEVVIKGGGYKVPKDEQTNRCSFTTKMKAEWADLLVIPLLSRR